MEQHEVPVRSIARALDVLMALTKGPLSLGAIADQTGLAKGTCHRLLASLGYRHLVVQDSSSGSYLLGPGCFRLVEAVTSGTVGISSIARAQLEELWRDTGETVTMHVRVGAQRICVEELPSAEPVRYVAGIGSTAPIYVGAAGKVLLAFVDGVDRDRLLASLRLAPVTDHTFTDADDLARELDRIRRRGWADSRGERVLGAAAVSAPVLDADGRVLAAVSVLGPEGRLRDEPTMRRVRERLLAAAEAINARMTQLEVGPMNGEDGAAPASPPARRAGRRSVP